MQVDRWIARDENGDIKMFDGEPDYMDSDGKFAQDVNGTGPRLTVEEADVKGNEVLAHLGLSTIINVLPTGMCVDYSLLLGGETFDGSL